MKKQEQGKLLKYFRIDEIASIETIRRGLYREGFFDGLKVAKRFYEMNKKKQLEKI